AVPDRRDRHGRVGLDVCTDPRALFPWQSPAQTLLIVPEPSMTPIERQTILVTGATDGLGRGVALDLLARGATVIVHARDSSRLQRTVAELAEKPGRRDRIRTALADFASLADVRRLAERVAADHDRLDALVNNAGIGTVVPGGDRRQLSQD